MKKLLYIGEPPTANTGFGTVSKGILPYLAKEFEILQLATGGYGQDCIKGIGQYGVKDVVITTPENTQAINLVDPLLAQHDFDAAFIYYDTGSVWEFIDKTSLSFRPIAAYTVTEGAPIMDAWIRLYDDFLFKQGFAKRNYTIEEPIVASQFDADEIERQTGRKISVGYHGADHANWRRISKDERAELRRQLGQLLNTDLSDYFLIMYVARNAERKMWPRLFEVAKYLKDNYPDFKFKIIAHTKKFDMFKEGGWSLPEIVKRKGLAGDDVFFYDRSDIGGNTSFESENPSDPSMLKYYNIADLYVNVSGAEACGLPMLEAARCGLPVLAPAYSGGWEYVQKFAVPLDIQTYITDKTGLNWALINIEDCAKKIYNLAQNKGLYSQHRDLGLKHCNYKWADLGNLCLAAANNAIERYKWRKL